MDIIKNKAGENAVVYTDDEEDSISLTASGDTFWIQAGDKNLSNLVVIEIPRFVLEEALKLDR